MRFLLFATIFTPLLVYAADPITLTSSKTKNSEPTRLPILTRTKVHEIDNGMNVRACNVFQDRVTKSYYAGNYFMYDKIEPIRLQDEVFSTIGNILEDPDLPKVQQSAVGKPNFYWANYEQRRQNNIPLEHLTKSNYAQRLIKLLDHLCR